METSRIAIVGLGTVGSGVARILLDQGERTSRHAGRRLHLARILIKDSSKSRELRLSKNILTDDLSSITDDPGITAVAELIGGLEPARSIILKLMESGKDIVTANKALLAEHGPELFDRARELGRSIAFEAAVAGGIPIVANISQCFSANQIQSIQAILNGTTNYILTQMESQGIGYDAASSEARRLGYAEADPTMDVDGTDATQKLAILAHLAFGARVHWREIPRVGVDNLQIADLNYAKELGYRVKLLAVAKLIAERLELHVGPTLVRMGSPLAEVYGSYNAVSVVGDAVGRLFFEGPGAGQMPTASAVIADLIDTVVGRTAITFRTLELWSQRRAHVAPSEFATARSRYYLRLNVEDRPGVLAEIAGVLGTHEISIASLIQHQTPYDADGAVPLVITTHETSEGAMQKSMAAVEKLSCTRGASVRMRILDDDGNLSKFATS